MKIAFTASEAEAAQRALATLTARYGQASRSEAEVVVALGGDGLMLQTLHDLLPEPRPVFGMNRGSVGFLMNGYWRGGSGGAIARRRDHPYRPAPHARLGRRRQYRGSRRLQRGVAVARDRQAAKLRIMVDGEERMEELICDGVLAATPAGSTAYNLSAHGPILPIDAELVALTPISAFRPRRWRGALLPLRAALRIDVLEARKRPVSAVADFHEARDVRRVDVASARDLSAALLFDPGDALAERLIKEQFVV